MTSAVFGDFLHQAGQHLDTALASSQDENADPAAAACELRRIAATMARYLEDRTPVDAIEAASRTDLNPWERAAIDTRAALHRAASCLTQHSTTADGTDHEPGHDTARSLAAAATSLAVGRDLLHTHLATTPQNLREHRSDWAPTLTSLPVTRALTAQIARWSRQLVPLTPAWPRPTPPAHRNRWSPGSPASSESVAVDRSAAIRPAQAADPVTAEDIRLLHAIPAAQPPERLPPSGAEPMAALCTGITTSAQRLRAAVSATAGQPLWTPP